MEGPTMNLSHRIRDLRYAKGWGPDDLAARAKISRTALYQIESGKTETPRAGTLRRIARALSIAPEELIGSAISSPGGSVVSLAALPRGSQDRVRHLEAKLRELLASPLGEAVALIIEESYRLLPATPPTGVGEGRRAPASSR
jgi:transcriptional regulator with XRE-family HTH domain